jgi:hypothetical protein
MHQPKLINKPDIASEKLKAFRYLSLLFFAVFLFCFKTYAQKSLTRVRSFALITGVGNSVHTTVDRYQVLYFTGDYSRSFRAPNKPSFLSYYFEPQFNLVRTMQQSLDYEFGLNGGIRNYIRVNPDLYFYQMLGSGPHYISAVLVKQANGFIFSDNLAIGIYKRINKNSLFLNLQFGIRHISNADLKFPNRGVNSFNILIGLGKIKRIRLDRPDIVSD